MDFHPAPPTDDMPHRWASENDVWEIGLRLMMYGVRVSVGKIMPGWGHALVYTLDYCAGMAQTDECMMFYDNKALTLYLNRGNDPMAWVKYCCEQAGIPYPVEDEPIPPSIGA